MRLRMVLAVVMATVAVALFPAVAHAAVTYQIQQSSGTSIIPGTTNIGNDCDDCTTLINFPFAVSVYGNTYTEAWASSNGNLQFDSDNNAYVNQCLYSSVLGTTIAPLWDDLLTDHASGEGIFTATIGSAPFREFVVEWRAVTISNDNPVNFEIVFYENTQTITTIYGQNTSGSATVGVQSSSGGSTQFSCNSGSIASGTRLDYIPSSGPAPTVNRFTRGFQLKSQLGTAQPTPVPVLVGWAATSNSGEGICSYQLEEELNGGLYTQVHLPSPTQTSILLNLPAGTSTAPNSYGFRLTATDCNGSSTVSNLTPFQVQAIPENASKVTRTGTWARIADSSAVGGSVYRSSKANSSATLTTTASNLALVAPTGPTYGSAKIYVDGVLKTTLNLHTTAAKKPRQEMYKIGFASAGSHTLKVVVVGTAGHPMVDIDAFAVLV